MLGNTALDVCEVYELGALQTTICRNIRGLPIVQHSKRSTEIKFRAIAKKWISLCTPFQYIYYFGGSFFYQKFIRNLSGILSVRRYSFSTKIEHITRTGFSTINVRKVFSVVSFSSDVMISGRYGTSPPSPGNNNLR